jgi:exodeoxyribonuclease VII small subunit
MTEKQATFEENLARLDQIVNQLEQGNVPLEDALEQFKEGMQLSKTLEASLTKAEQTLTKVINDEGEEVNFERDSDE